SDTASLSASSWRFYASGGRECPASAAPPPAPLGPPRSRPARPAVASGTPFAPGPALRGGGAPDGQRRLGVVRPERWTARGGEAQALHPPPDTGQALEQRSGPVGHQVV